MNYIYLDTNVFYGSNQKVQNYFVPPFSYLSMLSSYGVCELILPEVSKIEERAHIKKKISEFINNKVLPFQLIEEYRSLRNETKLREQFFSLYDKFLKSMNANFLPMSRLEIDAAEMVTLRYTQTAPFTSKKDNEFQDILIATSLINFFEQHSEDHFIVISNDKGFKEYLKSKYERDNLTFFDKLDDYTRPMLTMIQDKHKDVINAVSDYISGLSESLELTIFNCLDSNDFIIWGCGDSIESIENSSVHILQSQVEMAEVLDSEVYAYVLCKVSYWAKADVLDDSKLEFDYGKNDYIKKEYYPIEINKTWNVRFVINLSCEFDEDNKLTKIIDFNDIEIADGVDFILEHENIKYI